MLGEEVDTVKVAWWVVSEHCSAPWTNWDGGRDARALSLRETGLISGVVEGNEGGTERRRGLAVFRKGALEACLRVGSLRGVRDQGGLLSNRPAQELEASVAFFNVIGRENIEALDREGFVDGSLITRDAVNRRHNESRSGASVEGSLDKVAGVRVGWNDGILGEGRSGGGYIVGNA